MPLELRYRFETSIPVEVEGVTPDVVRGLSLLCGILAAGMIAVSIFVVCHMVIMRYVLNASTIWQTEFVVYMMLAATMIGMPYVQMLRGHVNVDLLPIYLRGVPRR